MPDTDFGELLEYLVKTQNLIEGKKASVIQKPECPHNVDIEPNNTKSGINNIPNYQPDVFIEPKPLISKSAGFDNKKFKELIRNKLIQKFKDKQGYEKPYTSVTELLNCVRYNYYYRSKTNIDYDKYFKFTYLDFYALLGTEIHELVQNINEFKEIKKALYSKTYDVKGEADAISPPFLYEFKTVDEKALFRLDYRNKDYIQGNIYAHILNTEYGYSLDKITLVYFFRDNLKRDPYAIDLNYNANLAITYLKRSHILLEHLRDNKLPNTIGSSEETCSYCVYNEICKKDNSKKDSIKVEESTSTEKEIKSKRLNVTTPFKI